MVTASFQPHQKDGASRVGGQKRPGDRGGDDSLQTQKSIVLIQEDWKIRRGREMSRALEEWRIEIKRKW